MLRTCKATFRIGILCGEFGDGEFVCTANWPEGFAGSDTGYPKLLVEFDCSPALWKPLDRAEDLAQN
jgi:hypothetical protein